jgi:plasmid maintenance system antidote protein VapI
MNKIKEKLKQQSLKDDGWLQDATYRQENESWLDLSFAIAAKVLETLRAKNLSQKELAERMGLSPQYINKVVKGSENLTIETITRLEKALGVKLISISNFEFVEKLQIHENP